MSGPFLFDFDNSGENLLAACSTTQEALGFILSEYSLDPIRDRRTFFSGLKGFHIELRPAAIKLELLRTRRGRTRIEWELIEHLRQWSGIEMDNPNVADNVLDPDGTILDPQHCAKRVNESINVWLAKGVVRKMKMVLVPTDVIRSGKPESLVEELVNQSTLA